MGRLLDMLATTQELYEPERELWDENKAGDLLQEYTRFVASVPVGVASWASDVELYPLDSERAIDEAYGRKDLLLLRQAVERFKEETAQMVAEYKRVQSVIRQAMNGTLKGPHRLPVRQRQRHLLGKVLLLVATVEQAEVLYVHAPPDTTVFHYGEFAAFIRALQAGESVEGWMLAKRRFKGITQAERGREDAG